MFESWLEQEKATIKSLFGNVRIFCVILAILMLPFALMQLVVLLDGGGTVSLCALIFCIFVIIFALSMSSYKKRFVKPLLASIQQELPTEEARREFAQQMQEQTASISYRPLPQTKSCDIIVAQDYCYMRQPRKSRILQNSRFRKVILSQEKYNVGYRGHIRWCYALALHTSDNEKPVWKGYFMSKEEVDQALLHIKAILPPEAVIQDQVANPEKAPQKPWWKTLLEWTIYILFFAGMLFLVKYLRS